MVSTLAQPMVDLVNRFRAQIKATLDAFVQQLQPGSGSYQVPPDSTVHELTSNVCSSFKLSQLLIKQYSRRYNKHTLNSTSANLSR